MNGKQSEGKIKVCSNCIQLKKKAHEYVRVYVFQYREVPAMVTD